jgi:hypothetical protein
MHSTEGPYFRIDYLPDLSETAAGTPISSPVQSATGSYYPEVISATTPSQEEVTPKLRIETKTYGIDKPRRVVMRGRVIRD